MAIRRLKTGIQPTTKTSTSEDGNGQSNYGVMKQILAYKKYSDTLMLSQKALRIINRK
jgi:hypothetical protein